MAGASKTFNVGVVGYGLSAKIFHIPYIEATPSLELYSILQRSPKPSDSAPNDYPKLQHHTNYDAFVADPALDVVVLTTTPATHFSLASQALKAGKHVLVEKPFVPTAAEADELVKLARETGRLIAVYQNRRWDADFLTVRKLVEDGTLGRIVEFETHIDRFRPEKPTSWKGTATMNEANGAPYDLGTHLFDQTHQLFGTPKSVFAKLVNHREGKFGGPNGTAVEDDTDGLSAQLFHDNGTTVYVRMNVMSVEKEQLRFWVRGTKGSYWKKNLDPQEEQLKAGMKLQDPGFGREPSEWTGKLSALGPDGKVEESDYPTVEPPTYLEFYKLFVRALASGKEADVPVKATEARDVLRIIEAVRESARTGKEVYMS